MTGNLLIEFGRQCWFQKLYRTWFNLLSNR